MKPIYKTTFSLTVLSDEPVTGMNTEQIGYEINEGPFLGSLRITATEELVTQEAVEAASKAVGNDGSFFDHLWEDESVDPYGAEEGAS